jgi:hypothetical protein
LCSSLEAKLVWIRILSIGSLLCTSSTSERPSGSVARRVRRSFEWGLSLGLGKDSETDKSKLDVLSYLFEIKDIFSFSQWDNTWEQPSESTK